MKIELKLLSDTCAASGLGAFGGVDADISVDGFGLPVIPAKRLKGVLREAGLDIVSVLPECEGAFHQLYGGPGASKPGELVVGTGELAGASGFKAEIKLKNYSPKEVSGLFTSLRTGTAMEGEGLIRRTDDNTLRLTRAADSGLSFHFDVQCPDDCADFLDKCCKSLRGIGSGRTRGLGEVECSLVREGPQDPVSQDSVSNEASARRGRNEENTGEISGFRAAGGTFTPHNLTDKENGKKFAHYTLALTSPVIVSPLDGSNSGTEDYIPGSLMLGAFAAAWLKTRGRECAAPHKDPEFQRLFLDGAVNFLSAYPQQENGGRILYPAPRSIRQSKNEANSAIDASVSEAPDEYTKILGGFAADEARLLHLGGVNKSIFAHHARPFDKAIGHALENSSPDSGAFYSYEALSEGQVFIGSLVGSEGDLEILRGLAPDSLMLGRSRSAQYGGAKLSWFAYPRLKDGRITIKDGGKFRVVLRSPAILTGADGVVTPDPSHIPGMLGLRGMITICKVFCSAAFVSGYNSKWMLPRTQETALGGGSVIVFANESGDDVEIPRENFIGLRAGEGFGHISVEELPRDGNLLIQKTAQMAASISGDPAGALENRIEKQKIPAHIRNEANKAKIPQLNPSQLGRLRAYLSTTDDFAKLAGKLSADNWKQTDDREKIQIFCVGEKTEDTDELAEKLRKKAKQVALHDARYPNLLDPDELFYWYKTYLIRIIERVVKEARITKEAAK